MKNKYIAIVFIFWFNNALAQNNIFNNPGNIGLGTTSPTTLLNLNHPFAQIKLQGASGTWINSDIIISRTSSNPQLGKSPNIAFADDATSTAAYIQSYQGNLQLMPSGLQSMTLATTGYVGVNASSPISIFQINSFGTKFNVGSANTTSLNGTSYIGFNAARNSSGNWRFDGNPNGDGGAVVYSDVYGNINFAAVPSLNGSAYFEKTDDQLKTYIAFQITSAGIVRAKKFKVELINWPDFVFDKDYRLPSLNSVRAYINENHHLPDMPSAEDVKKNGLDLGEMDKILVKKVEELTIYAINAANENKGLREKLLLQEKRLKALESKLNKLIAR
jgi:hypothetical protein